MNQLIVVAFDHFDDARKAMSSLRGLEREGRIRFEDTSIVERDPDGTAYVKNEVSGTTETAAVVGAVIGGLVTFVFPPVGMLLGAALGAAVGAAMDTGVSAIFIDESRRRCGLAGPPCSWSSSRPMRTRPSPRSASSKACLRDLDSKPKRPPRPRWRRLGFWSLVLFGLGLGGASGRVCFLCPPSVWFFALLKPPASGSCPPRATLGAARCGRCRRRRQEPRRDPDVGRLLERVGEADQRWLVPAAADERHADRQRADVARRHRDGRVAGDRGRARRADERREVAPEVAVHRIGHPGRAVRRRDDRVEVVRGQGVVDRRLGDRRRQRASHLAGGVGSTAGLLGLVEDRRVPRSFELRMGVVEVDQVLERLRVARPVYVAR